MPRFAANLSMMFNEVAFLDRFGAAARAGFDAVEFLFPYEHPPEAVAEKLGAHGLTQALFNLPPGDFAAGERGIACLPDRAGELRAGVETALVYARATVVKRLHMMAGLGSRQNAAAVAAYRDAVSFAADRLAEAGIDLVLEPINGRDMPGYFLDDFNWTADLIAELARPNLKLQFDIYHRQIMRGDVATAMADLMPIIGHVQVASVPRRHEPMTGELNDVFLFSELDRLGYAGFVGCEYRPAGATTDGLGWFDGARPAGGRAA
ncbi:hydroxypyruvate isomerase [Aureimonas sp. SA4125]|uniref:2-oxo-tetronate isomerase n=1 Tax=Aureimonas sp. SA4125 TaxID=2826993 RepID=UPI001CC73859|nr:2-oxo-tetronate isomerase [Aureimonas sp. SA4125]BDA86413.1 hydroxypyruvate isomerase [Aureimonas sp. SA4125]